MYELNARNEEEEQELSQYMKSLLADLDESDINVDDWNPEEEDYDNGPVDLFDDEELMKSDKPLKDPKGGLTAAGRAHFNRTTGSKLKPGVRGPADTPEKMRRKGSFLTRFFTNPSGPMVNDKGEPTRLALSAHAWGEPVPKNMDDAKKLAEKGRRLLERYQETKKGDKPNHPFRGNQYTRGAGARKTTKPKVAPKTLKSRLTINGKRAEAKAQKVRDYMMAPAKRFKDPNWRRYATARINQMTSGKPRPSGMSKKYNMTREDVVRCEMVLSRIFASGRSKFGI